MSITIEGYYERTIMKNEKTGFTIFSLIPESDVEESHLNNYKRITCQGITIPFGHNEFVALSGDWKSDAYGPYFQVEKIEQACKSRAAAIRFLASGNICLSYEKATAIVDSYGEDIYAMCNRSGIINELSKLLDISKRKVTVLLNEIETTYSWHELFNYGFDKGLSYNSVARLMEAYGSRAKAVLCKDPYGVGSKFGVSFSCCDAIAFDNGMTPLNKDRITTVAKTALTQIQNKGHVFADEREFYESVDSLLSKRSSFMVPRSVISNSIRRDKGIYIEEDDDTRIYLSENHYAEQNVAYQISRLIGTQVMLPFNNEIVDYAQSVCGVTFAPEQRDSFNLLRKTGVAILTGGPGTGKTTVMKGLITAYQKMNPTGRIKLCAPSGRAAQRMSESTGMEASTIHRLLEYKPFDGGSTHKDANNPIEAEVVIVDEASMVDLSIADLLLSAMKPGSLLLMAGDVNQLQSVGCGDFLNDCIKSGVIPVVQLKKVYRQANDSPIVSNAYAINSGRSNLIEDENFEIITTDNAGITKAVCAIAKAHHDKDNPFYVQVLCPTHKGEGGVAAINKELQAILNPGQKKKLIYGTTEFRLGDKIVMLKNNPNMGYFNGDIGVIKDIEESKITVTIQETDIVLTRENFDDLKLAYAMTIHKSQGSEFPITIISLPTCNMLQRNLLYTGVTRGKKSVVIVQEKGNIERCVLKCEVGKRNSRLMTRIQAERK